MSSERTADVMVIGLGPGGEDVAGRLAQAGVDVVAVDEHLVGGECPYWGCIPTKMMVRAANALAEARRVPGLAGSVHGVQPDWRLVADRIRDEATDDWDDRVAVERLEGKGARFVRGHASLEGRRPDGGFGIRVGGALWQVQRVVVNTGTVPSVPPVEGIGDVDYWTNHGLVEARELPGSLVVLGAGAVGCELAQVAARFGAAVTVVEKAPRLLAVEEPQASEVVSRVFAEEGIDVRVGVGATHVGPHGTGGAVRVRLEDGAELAADRLLVASGRRVDVRAVGLHTVGVEEDAQVVPTDAWGRVSDGVWALGDIVGHGAFTHMSMYEADVVVRDLLGQGGAPGRFDAVPRVTFTDPEVGAVGLTAEQARERYADVRVGTVELGGTSRGWLHGPGGEGFITVVEDAARGVLVGATSVGPTGGEVLGFLALAVSAQVPVRAMLDMPYAYPTMYRGIETALRELPNPA